MTETVLIVDFGSQVTQLIARRVREAGVYGAIYPFHRIDADLVAKLGPMGIILSGGPASVTDPAAPQVPEAVLGAGVPILGICYGQQALCVRLGGQVAQPEGREYGRATIEVARASRLTEALWEPGARASVWMSHGDAVTALPAGFVAAAGSEHAPYALIADDRRGYYGVQFHPEVAHTPEGARLLSNFVRHVCGCTGDWTMVAFRDKAIRALRHHIGSSQVICGLSGGVDSAVTAVLLHEAIGDQLTCIFVDTGLLRAGEAADVVNLFRDSYNIPLVHRDASDLFVQNLAGVADPESKRRIVGNTFVEVFEAEAQSLGGAAFLAQGTLYPDVIESVSAQGGPSATIKSHHNVGGLPERMDLALVEPLRELFKDEVRELGRTLGLPERFVKRQPFPGPGLAIRIPGAVDDESLHVLRQADTIFHEEIAGAGLYDAIWQAFAVLLPVRTVGVMGDERTYDRVCALRAVTSTDGMTADYYPFDHGFLGRTATRIVNEVRGINRVVYDVTSKPPGTVEWE